MHIVNKKSCINAVKSVLVGFVGMMALQAQAAGELRVCSGKDELPYSNDKQQGFENEIAKIHIRYMVGGRTDKVANERVYSFEFPERPGALGNFLMAMQSGWNITLFHYRNHGADYGRILIGIDVPPEDDAALAEFIEKLGFVWQDHTQNEAYRLFL